MRFSTFMLRLRVAPLGLVLFACGGDGPVEPLEPESPAATALALVSGDHQEGKAGEPLPEPFVVRVTDARGDGVGDVEVTWRVASGAGGLWRELGRTGGQSTVVMEADRDGIARVFFRPGVPGTSTVAAEAGGLQGSTVTFTTEVAPHAWPPVAGSALLYERVSEHWRTTLAYHGTLLERYVLHEDGSFRLQFDSGRFGFFEYSGTYSGEGAAIEFAFDDDSRWRATGTSDGSECLVVEYNIVMALSDFEDGVYCRSSETP